MTTMAELILKADYSQMDRAKGSLDSLTEAGGKASSAMRSLAATLGVAFGIKEVLDAAQAYTTINNRLALVTDSTEQLAAAQKQIFDISQQTRQPLEATAEVYQRLATNAGQLGITLDQVGKTTDTINKLITISGTSAESSAAALTQLGQAFASGTLRGDELNSVMEQAPALAKAIADGMGVTVGQLRALGEQGKLTATAVINALNEQGNAVNEQFNKMTPTISQSMSMIGNSFINFVGHLDDATGASRGLAGALADISRSLDEGGALSASIRLYQNWEIAIRAIKEDADGLTLSMDKLGQKSQTVSSFIGQAFVDLPNNVRTIIQLATLEIADFTNKAVSGFQTIKEASKAVFTGDTIAEALKRGDARWNAYESAYQAQQGAILAENENLKAQGDFLSRRAELEKLLDGSSSLKTGGGPAAAIVDPKKEEEARKQAEREAKHLEQQRIYWQNEITDQMNALEREGAQEQEHYQRKLQRLQDMFASESELENLQYAAKLESYAAYAEAFRISESDQQSAREKMLLEHQARMDVARRNDANSDLKTLSGRLGATQKFMNDIYTATGSHNQRMFKLIQTAGAAQAAANAYVAASQALADPSVPFFAKFAAVAQVLATGFGLVNSLKGLGSSDGGGGGGASAGSAPDTSGIAPQAQPTIRAQTVDFRIETRGIWRDDDVADLMQAIGERLGDGAKFGKVEFLTK